MARAEWWRHLLRAPQLTQLKRGKTIYRELRSSAPASRLQRAARLKIFGVGALWAIDRPTSALRSTRWCP
ncbi:hypothetical protein C9I57_28060 [Trinickia symbiotica]|uniref:Uncharacterized protein n=1 Tax=Trinickia symbiotica TaxID=863227 RepID=A0A2N7X624_9BURK|nr:hypothetical protein C0Z20_07705 [Trinickia symbiotica]PTB17538.1 hypothetical protein C9I57_28060 [Trinickia symbiotica]